jgi:hypothetical protein
LTVAVATRVVSNANRAVIVVAPGENPVTRPDADTAATEVFEENQRSWLCCEVDAFVESCAVEPTSIDTWLGEMTRALALTSAGWPPTAATIGSVERSHAANVAATIARLMTGTFCMPVIEEDFVPSQWFRAGSSAV